MKFFMRTFILLLLISVAYCNPLCSLYDAVSALDNRLQNAGVTLGNKILSSLDGNADVKNAARFKNNPDLSEENEAFEQMYLALGETELLAPNLISDDAVEALTDTLFLKRVIDADQGINYQTMGSGVGKFADRAGADANTKCKNMLTKVRAVFDQNHAGYSNYSEAKYLKDLDTIFEDSPSNDGFSLGDFIAEQANNNKGKPLEVRLIASRKGEGIVALSSHDIYEGSDLVTEVAVYNAAYSKETIKNKLTEEKIPDIAKGVIKAHEDGLPYKFVIAEDTGDDLTSVFNDLNNKIQETHPEISLSPDNDIILQDF